MAKDKAVLPSPAARPPTAYTSALHEAEVKAWDALARYKFWMFGYWAGIWVHLNRLSGERRPNPWKQIVEMAKKGVIELKK